MDLVLERARRRILARLPAYQSEPYTLEFPVQPFRNATEPISLCENIGGRRNKDSNFAHEVDSAN